MDTPRRLDARISDDIGIEVPDIGAKDRIITVNTAGSMALNQVLFFYDQLDINRRVDSGLSTELGYFVLENYVDRADGLGLLPMRIARLAKESAQVQVHNGGRSWRISQGVTENGMATIPRLLEVGQSTVEEAYVVTFAQGDGSWRKACKLSKRRNSAVSGLEQYREARVGTLIAVPSDVFPRFAKSTERLEKFLEEPDNVVLVTSAKSTSLSALADTVAKYAPLTQHNQYYTAESFPLFNPSSDADGWFFQYQGRLVAIEGRLRDIFPRLKGARRGHVRNVLREWRERKAQCSRAIYMYTHNVLALGQDFSPKQQSILAYRLLKMVPVPNIHVIDSTRTKDEVMRFFPRAYLQDLHDTLQARWRGNCARARPKSFRELESALRQYRFPRSR